jgi:hypothetical protein
MEAFAGTTETMGAAACGDQRVIAFAAATLNAVENIPAQDAVMDSILDRNISTRHFSAAKVGSLPENPRDPCVHAVLWVQRIFLPAVLYGMGQLVYWIWFGVMYSGSFWWQLICTLLLLIPFVVVTVWFLYICFFTDPELAEIPREVDSGFHH